MGGCKNVAAMEFILVAAIILTVHKVEGDLCRFESDCSYGQECCDNNHCSYKCSDVEIPGWCKTNIDCDVHMTCCEDTEICSYDCDPGWTGWDYFLLALGISALACVIGVVAIILFGGGGC